MRRFCVIGTPVGHSKSPQLFERFSSERGIVYGTDAEYLRHEITDRGQLEEFVKEMRLGLWDGCNVTMPWKTDMVNMVDELSETARITGSVNTVSAKKGHLYGDSTDGRGMLNAISGELGREYRGTTVVLGCGGAARSIIAELMVRKTGRLVIACRDAGHEAKEGSNLDLTLKMLGRMGENLNLTLKMLGRMGENVEFVDISDITMLDKAIAGADALINSTPLGMLDGHGNENRLPLPEEIEFTENLIVADCVYNPDETLLIKKARESGCTTVKGIRMLEEQARCGVDILLG